MTVYNQTYPPEVEQPKLERPLSEFLRELLESLLLAFFVFWLVNLATANRMVDGQSMDPTLESGQRMFINRLSYLVQAPTRGDIIVFELADKPEGYPELIKRIIGVPGDTVEVRNGQVSVNGIILDEPYILEAPTYTGRWTVPEEQVFVLGDNRNNSSDSHIFSFLPREQITGKAWFTYWPTSLIGETMPHHDHGDLDP